MRHPFNPSVEIVHYCEHICNAHIQTLRYDYKKRVRFWDYPAMAAICHDIACMKKRASYSHRPQKDEFHPALQKALLCLGEIGEKCKRPGNRYPIGNCAEQHAANIYMKQCEEKDLSKLFFSVAMRPRTKQIFEYCDNCKDVFPNL